MLITNNIPLEKRVDLYPSNKKMWRTLIRVDSITPNIVGFVIPGWGSNQILYFDIKEIPEKLVRKIRGGMKPHYRFHAYVNIGVEKAEDIYIDFR